eukprot:3522134-Rhodomonas_salina.1
MRRAIVIAVPVQYQDTRRVSASTALQYQDTRTVVGIRVGREGNLVFGVEPRVYRSHAPQPRGVLLMGGAGGGDGGGERE